MITLTILTFNGGPTERLSASFDELGGTIGRADTNQLILPDPERTISRVHAQVAFRNDGFALVDRGSNPVLVNGRALGNGAEAPLKAGDQVQIGGYVLSVEASAGAAAPVDPFADLVGFGGGLAGAPPAFAATAPMDPFASLGSAGGIPLDWDPFAPDPVPAHDLGRSLGAAPSAIPDDFGLGLGGPSAAPLVPDVGIRGTAAEDSLDELFGLGPASNRSGDPLAGSAFQDPLSKPNTAQNADPLRSFMSGPASAGSNAMADNVSELNTPFIPPKVVAPKPASPQPAAPIAPASGPAPQGAVLSWGDQAGGAEGRTIIRPASKPTMPAAMPTPPVATSPSAAFAAAPAPAYVPPPVAAPRPTSSTAGSADVQALLAAFREGLGVPSLQIDALTPEMMKLIGQLLHESAKGTVDLLVARAALKREIRAEVTMIVARENNPLKFSPSVDVALTHLLTPPARGFMQPAPAMRDAYDDLRAHQFGFVAGMKAALEGVLKRFDPAILEGKLTQKSVINSLLPATRKAKLWEVFQDLYGQISEEAAEDFHDLFGREFLRAYEAHIDQLKDGQH
ncbi:type VI secretion system-associated FHA domain protein TagH [Aquabacterium sp.]|uniref:type VI secretion system-associated FHA domain protein TagH n=1 Tax=Aquabacterium sp. TaxID=1872578 RepID=UPI001990806C|nr:type VI secretion system-associated FHA domain protein TagH [Aquabacterium sp.]MBC7699621.1 type VI secretion system-associated FHA domain protein TagH [Aquabacterium sp.]